MRPILEVKNLSKNYGGVQAVDVVSFSVERGSITGLIGPNGAGKSTALNVIGGLLPPAGGSVVFDGVDVTGQPMHRLARRGLVRTFQLARVFGNLTTIENLLVAAPAHRGDSPLGILAGKRYWGQQERQLVEQARGLLASFGMTGKEDEYARNLSGGQKRAVETMRALITGGGQGEPFAFAEQREFCEAHVKPWVFDCCTAIQNSLVANYYRRVAEFTQLFMAIERDSFAID